MNYIINHHFLFFIIHFLNILNFILIILSYSMNLIDIFYNSIIHSLIIHYLISYFSLSISILLILYAHSIILNNLILSHITSSLDSYNIIQLLYEYLKMSIILISSHYVIFLLSYYSILLFS